VALVDEHLDGDGEHEVDAEGLDLDGGAEAERGVEVGHALQQRAALLAGLGADHGVHQPVERVHARQQLQRVQGALARGRRRGRRRRRARHGRRGRRRRLRRRAGRAGRGRRDELRDQRGRDEQERHNAVVVLRHGAGMMDLLAT